MRLHNRNRDKPVTDRINESQSSPCKSYWGIIYKNKKHYLDCKRVKNADLGTGIEDLVKVRLPVH